MTKTRKCSHWSHIRVENAYNNYADFWRAGDPEAILKKAIAQVDRHLNSGKCQGHRA